MLVMYLIIYDSSGLRCCLLGTDATHAEHIETIKSRLYVGVRPDGKFVPGELGMGLVEGVSYFSVKHFDMLLLSPLALFLDCIVSMQSLRDD